MATRSIRTTTKQGVQQEFDAPEQLVGYDFALIEIDKGDWTQDQIRSYMRPALSKFGGELRER